MRTILMALAASVAVTASAQAASVSADRLNGGILYRYEKIGSGGLSEQWNLRGDGRLTGVWIRTRSTADHTIEQSGPIAGTWAVRNGRLCVEGSGLTHRGPACYTLARSGSGDKTYTITGPGGTASAIVTTRPGVESAVAR